MSDQEWSRFDERLQNLLRIQETQQGQINKMSDEHDRDLETVHSRIGTTREKSDAETKDLTDHVHQLELKIETGFNSLELKITKALQRPWAVIAAVIATAVVGGVVLAILESVGRLGN